MTDAASRAQIAAADPSSSVWLAANAGSGKTKVLTDRVARLLLDGVAPQRILCLTYTKAAASEMQNRLFKRLGRWSMLPERELVDELRALDDRGAVGPANLAEARRLFASAIETPGGLKIQTIHAFCAALLRRFPLEARVSPDFTELDERSALLLRAEVLDEMADGADPGAVAALAQLLSGEGVDKLLAEICQKRDAFLQPVTAAALEGQLGLAPGDDAQALVDSVFTGGEGQLLGALVPRLLTSGKTDRSAGEKLAGLVQGLQALPVLENTLLFGKDAKAPFGAKIGAFPTKDLRLSLTGLLPDLEALMGRVEGARPRRIALEARDRTLALYHFARAFLPLYEARKAERGALDFDDLIRKAADLLSDPQVAAWVLYRLDGGIDHILVDEAQDTSPGQWRVIERLAEEFTAGEGARAKGRRIFVVGDKKQSIYSFQGADLATFDRMHGEFAQRHAGAGAPFDRLELSYSFRSADAILRLVDATFDGTASQGVGGQTRHHAFRGDMPGRVDLWAPIAKTEAPEEKPWFEAVDELADTHETVLLARKIASEVARMKAEGTAITVKGAGASTLVRPMHEGDVLILVRRRGPLFHAIIRACKAKGLEVAGADRLKLLGELGVRDILALLSFVALPEDDLALATTLRSPLFGWSEGALYDLAHGRRPGEYLWQALRAAETPDAVAARAVLNDLRDWADFLRPYELIERVLIRHDGRRRLLARLGREAEDAIDALLAEALVYEQAAVPDLTGFLVWMESGDVEVKRRMDGAAQAIRVMTVHGAKGLEAPIVILPDTAKWGGRDSASIVVGADGTAFWRMAKAARPEAVEAAAARIEEAQADERMRLLYVALTRAESWLIICAAGDVGAEEGEASWYRLIEAGMARIGAAEAPPGGGAWDFGPGRRFETGLWPGNLGRVGAEAVPVAEALPEWAFRPAPPGPGRPRVLSPSGLGGAKALPGEGGMDEAAAVRRGTLIHRLIEILPGAPRAEWAALADGIIGPDAPDRAALLAEAEAVVTAPDLGWLFGPGTLAEVELAADVPGLGPMQGTIDRLVVGPDRVMAVDFKSNAVLPARPEEVPEGILRQLGAYAEMLALIYPDRRIEVAVLWTRAAQLMPVPCNIVRSAMQAPPIS